MKRKKDIDISMLILLCPSLFSPLQFLTLPRCFPPRRLAKQRPPWIEWTFSPGPRSSTVPWSGRSTSRPLWTPRSGCRGACRTGRTRPTRWGRTRSRRRRCLGKLWRRRLEVKCVVHCRPVPILLWVNLKLKLLTVFSYVSGYKRDVFLRNLLKDLIPDWTKNVSTFWVL